MYWYEEYIGKPWANIANPPHTFNCGELVRYIHKVLFGIDTPPILADGNSLRECIANLSLPETYGLMPYEGPRRAFDCVYLRRAARRDHIAIAVILRGTLAFLHCIQGPGVILETEFEMKATTGSSFMEWRRHKDLTEEMVRCHA